MGERDGERLPGFDSEPTEQPGGAAGSPATEPASAPGIGAGGASEPASKPASKPASGGKSAGGKRGPGRPPKTGGSHGQAAESVRLRVDQADRPAKRETVANGVKRAATGQAGDAQASANALIVMLQSVLVGTIGPDAAMTPMEQMLIVPPATRMLARADEAALARYAAVADPLVLLVGLGVYGFRVYAAVQGRRAAAERAESGRGTAPEQAGQPAPGPVSAAPAPVPSDQAREARRNGVAPPPAILAAANESSDLEGF